MSMRQQAAERTRQTQQASQRAQTIDRDELMRRINEAVRSGADLTDVRGFIAQAMRQGVIDYGDLESFEEMFAELAPQKGSRKPAAIRAEVDEGGEGAEAEPGVEVAIAGPQGAKAPAASSAPQSDEQVQKVMEQAVQKASQAVTQKAAPEVGTLASWGSYDMFIQGMQAVEARWTALSPADRAKALEETLFDVLRSNNLPLPVTLVKDLKGSQGQFDYTHWTIALHQNMLEKQAIKPGEIEALAGTLYHEARHLEQLFGVARLMAGQGQTAAQISQQTGINPAMVQKAAQQPLGAGTAAASEAQEFYDELFGASSQSSRAVRVAATQASNALAAAMAAERRTIGELKALLADPNATQEQKVALAQVAQQAMAAVAQAKAAYPPLRAAYYKLPTEADAELLGGAARSMFRAL
jgi:hypothetical protein